MKLFNQKAVYLKSGKFFVDRNKYFTDESAAQRDLESFACRNNPIKNVQYKCVVTEVRVIRVVDNSINYLLAKKLC